LDNILNDGTKSSNSKQMNVNPFDPKINITWPESEYIISDQDSLAPYEEEARKLWHERNL
jgi:hypothetical protein